MQISEIVLKGWRSFDFHEGILLKDLTRINILIGPNNSGKSNVGKYFFWIKEMLNDKEFSIDSNISQYGEINSIKFKIHNKQIWAWEENEIQCNIKLLYNKEEFINSKPYFPQSEEGIVSLQCKHDFKNSSHSFSLVDGDRPLIALTNDPHPQVLDLQSGRYVDFNKDIPLLLDTRRYWSELASRLVFIDPIRHDSRQSNSTGKNLTHYYDGSDILSTLSSLQSSDSKSWQRFEDQINEWLTDLLNEQVEFRIEANRIIFRLLRDGKKITAAFGEVGTGVAQIFMILSFLFLKKDRGLIIFLDEPESNLHPEAVRKLIKIFESTFIRHCFFITTHSSVLIDQVSKDWSIHRVVRKKDSPSKIFPCNTLVSKYETLDDLGIRASQILQSNLVIWVEGPSDRMYLNKWIKDISKKCWPDLNLEEGKHYSFLMYGGSNLSSHTILAQDHDEIDILCTSRYSVIFCDSDYKNANDEHELKLKNRVKELMKRFEFVKKSEIGQGKNIEDYIKIWITEGRETENYIPKDLFCQVLSCPPLKKERLKDGDTYVDLMVDQSLISSVKFNKFDSFDDFFANMYRRADGSLLSDNEKTKISLKYSTDKVLISKEIVSNWKAEYYELPTDLVNNTKEVIMLIMRANGIDQPEVGSTSPQGIPIQQNSHISVS